MDTTTTPDDHGVAHNIIYHSSKDGMIEENARFVNHPSSVSSSSSSMMRMMWYTCYLYCTLLSLSFVGSIYVLVPSHIRHYPRDDPRQIRYRTIATTTISLVAWCTYNTVASKLFHFSKDGQGTYNDLEHDAMQVKDNETFSYVYVMRYSVIYSTFVTILVLFHTSILYLGPIVQRWIQVREYLKRQSQQQQEHTDSVVVNVTMLRIVQTYYNVYMRRTLYALLFSHWSSEEKDTHSSLMISNERWIAIRNLIVAPCTEEIVFRGCIVSALLQINTVQQQQHSQQQQQAEENYTFIILIAPFFFGIAHIHHAFIKWKEGIMSIRHVVLSTLFQFTYTSIFGTYVSYVYVHTQSICAVIMCHSFCNAMGLPDIGGVFVTSSLLYPYRQLLVCTHIIGLLGFIGTLKYIPIIQSYISS